MDQRDPTSSRSDRAALEATAYVGQASRRYRGGPVAVKQMRKRANCGMGNAKRGV
jgi:hypothetical protein